MTQETFGIRDIQLKLEGIERKLDKNSKPGEKLDSVNVPNTNNFSEFGKLFDSTLVRDKKSFASNLGISTEDILKNNIEETSYEFILESGKNQIDVHTKNIKKSNIIIPGSSNNTPDRKTTYIDFYFETNNIKYDIYKNKILPVILEIIYYKLKENEFIKISKKIEFNIDFNNEIPEIFLVKIPINELDKELYSYIKLIYNKELKTFNLDSNFKKPVSYIYIKNNHKVDYEKDEEDNYYYPEDYEEDVEKESNIIYNIIKNQQTINEKHKSNIIYIHHDNETESTNIPDIITENNLYDISDYDKIQLKYKEYDKTYKLNKLQTTDDKIRYIVYFNIPDNNYIINYNEPIGVIIEESYKENIYINLNKINSQKFYELNLNKFKLPEHFSTTKITDKDASTSHLVSHKKNSIKLPESFLTTSASTNISQTKTPLGIIKLPAYFSTTKITDKDVSTSHVVSHKKNSIKLPESFLTRSASTNIEQTKTPLGIIKLPDVFITKEQKKVPSLNLNNTSSTYKVTNIGTPRSNEVSPRYTDGLHSESLQVANMENRDSREIFKKVSNDNIQLVKETGATLRDQTDQIIEEIKKNFK